MMTKKIVKMKSQDWPRKKPFNSDQEAFVYRITIFDRITYYLPYHIHKRKMEIKHEEPD